MVLSDGVLLLLDLPHLFDLRRKEVDAAALVILLTVLAEAALVEEEVLTAGLAVRDGLENLMASAAGIEMAISIENVVDTKES